MVHDEKIRGVIDTIGRFHAERKAVLDTLKARLRELDVVPIVFDWDKPNREAAAVFLDPVEAWEAGASAPARLQHELQEKDKEIERLRALLADRGVNR